MIEFKTRYMRIPLNSVKPLEHYVRNSLVGEKYNFSSQKEVEELIKKKLKEGWIYNHRDETEAGFILFFKRHD